MLQTLHMMAMVAKYKLAQKLSEEKGEVNIVAIVVLIGIAVLLALIFKGQIEDLLETMFGTITKNAVEAVGGQMTE